MTTQASSVKAQYSQKGKNVDILRLVTGNSIMNADSIGDDTKKDMMVIGASFGRTGTLSFHSAMQRLGLKTYHFTNGVMETKGHLDMWCEYAKLMVEEEEGPEKEAKRKKMMDGILDQMAKDGFQATSDFPACFIYKELMERYPNARVVLTVRGGGLEDGESWAESMNKTILRANLIVANAPFKWISTVQKLLLLSDGWMFSSIGVHNVSTVPADPNLLANTYREWNREVLKYVPSDRILVFAAKDGWAPLCEFLSPLSPEIAALCDEIMANGEPYPRLNDTAAMSRGLDFMQGIVGIFAFFSHIGTAVATCFFFIFPCFNNNSKKKAAVEYSPIPDVKVPV